MHDKDSVTGTCKILLKLNRDAFSATKDKSIHKHILVSVWAAFAPSLLMVSSLHLEIQLWKHNLHNWTLHTWQHIRIPVLGSRLHIIKTQPVSGIYLAARDREPRSQKILHANAVAVSPLTLWCSLRKGHTLSRTLCSLPSLPGFCHLKYFTR